MIDLAKTWRPAILGLAACAGLFAICSLGGLHTNLTFGPAGGPEFDTHSDEVATLRLPIQAAPQAYVEAPGAFKLVAQRRVDAQLTGAQAWEPTILVTHADQMSAAGDAITVVWMDGRPNGVLTDTRAGMARSADGGLTWTTEEWVPPAESTNIQFDPMSALDAGSGRAYFGAMSRNFSAGIVDTIWLAGKDGAAATFESPGVIVAQEGVDKAWVAAGRLPAPLNGAALYLAYSVSGAQNQVRRSVDGGISFEAPLALPGTIGYQPRVSADGTLTISYYSGGKAALIKSLDGLQSLSTPITISTFAASPLAIFDAVPGAFRVPYFVMHAVDPTSGRLYAVYNDVTQTVGGQADVDLLLRDSVDGGQSWSAPRIVNGDSDPAGDQFMPWLECDAKGRLHLAYFDTRRNPSVDNASNALLDVYYATSGDGGATWQELRLTATPLDSAATHWAPVGTAHQFVGDYLGLSVSQHAAYVAYPGDDAGAVAMWVARIDFASDDIFANGFETLD